MLPTKITFMAITNQFPGDSGWIYVDVPKKYTTALKTIRSSWGMFPISVSINKTNWETKLMTKKGGNYFIALKASIRLAESISVGDKLRISFCLFPNI
ncbi:DUF1905 domain-containing protein [bacterium]|jgi:hypothetical protein|nr:DUF1905 domain-containing protein [bacterium]